MTTQPKEMLTGVKATFTIKISSEDIIFGRVMRLEMDGKDILLIEGKHKEKPELPHVVTSRMLSSR